MSSLFRSVSLEKKWVQLQEEKNQLQSSEKLTDAKKQKINVLLSLMSACKVGFNLPDAKVKKVIKFLSEETGVDNVRYGSLHKDAKVHISRFKDIVIQYTTVDGSLVFRELELQEEKKEKA